MENEKKGNKRYTAGGLLFVGCMFIGMGAGFLYGNMIGGLFIGMGAGFVAFGIAVLSAKT